MIWTHCLARVRLLKSWLRMINIISLTSINWLDFLKEMTMERWPGGFRYHPQECKTQNLAYLSISAGSVSLFAYVTGETEHAHPLLSTHLFRRMSSDRKHYCERKSLCHTTTISNSRRSVEFGHSLPLRSVLLNQIFSTHLLILVTQPD